MLKRIILLALVLPTMALAQLKVSTGGDPKVSTYAKMFTEVAASCGGLENVPSKGAVENLERLVSNQVNMGIVQTDLIYIRGKSDDLSHLKTLVTLHQEEVHLLVKASGLAPTGKLEKMNPFSSRTQPRDIDDTRGRSVTAWGGSVITAKIISQLLNLDWNVVPAEDAKNAGIWFAEDKVDLLLAVGGAPLPVMQGFTSAVRVLNFSSNAIDRLKDVYVPAKLSYANMGSMGVPTVATEALLVTQNYKGAAQRSKLLDLRKCINSRLDDLREGVGMHPKWKDVNPSNRGKWAYYD